MSTNQTSGLDWKPVTDDGEKPATPNDFNAESNTSDELALWVRGRLMTGYYYAAKDGSFDLWQVNGSTETPESWAYTNAPK